MPESQDSNLSEPRCVAPGAVIGAWRRIGREIERELRHQQDDVPERANGRRVFSLL